MPPSAGMSVCSEVMRKEIKMREAYLQRMNNVYMKMEEQGVTCMLITPSPDMIYLTGYSLWADERLLTVVLAPGHDPFLVANRLYEQSLAGVPYRDIIYWTDTENPYQILKREIERRGISTKLTAIDETLAAGLLIPIMQMFPESRMTLAREILEKLRLYKDSYEMECMRTACKKASEALRITMEKGRFWIGHTENELADALCSEMVKQGLAYGSASVCCQENAAEPHHLHDETVIRDHTCVMIDFGSAYQNYNTDMTRTFYFGEPDQEFLKVYHIVNEARKAGIAAARTGNPLGAVDDAARGVIHSYGYGQYFTHRTGHGIGIKNHEGPSAQAGETTLIAPGMAFSVEPGIYIPGRFGVRIEDQILIDENGSTTKLHDYPTELMVFR